MIYLKFITPNTNQNMITMNQVSKSYQRQEVTSLQGNQQLQSSVVLQFRT